MILLLIIVLVIISGLSYAIVREFIGFTKSIKILILASRMRKNPDAIPLVEDAVAKNFARVTGESGEVILVDLQNIKYVYREKLSDDTDITGGKGRRSYRTVIVPAGEKSSPIYCRETPEHLLEVSRNLKDE